MSGSVGPGPTEIVINHPATGEPFLVDAGEADMEVEVEWAEYVEAVYDDNYVDMVTGRVDLALRLGRLADVQLVARRVGAIRVFPCASPEYLAAAPPLRDPAELKAHRCISFSGYRRGLLVKHANEVELFHQNIHIV